MPLYVWLMILQPLWVTLLALIALVCLLTWTGLWARYRFRILFALLVLYLIDAGFSLPRVLFSYSLSNRPVIVQKIPLPRQLVLIDVRCGTNCHNMLISGALDEVIYVASHSSGGADAVMYRPGWTIPGACPRERLKAIDESNEALLWTGYCPLVTAVDIPSRGIFLIRETMIVTASQQARSYSPAYLMKTPPGPLIHFAGVEVQDRTASDTRTLASAYRYEAPGFLGLPPLIGCWNRPDNVIWIMPPGDTGCGFWRWFTWGGDEKAATDPKWAFDLVFEPPDRTVVPPIKIQLKPPTPEQALDILANVEQIEYYLPSLRAALLDPSNTDQALAELIVKRSRRGTLEGALIALLATRPKALADLSHLLNPLPFIFAKSGAVIDEMEKNPKFRDEIADVVLLALAARWHTPENIDRFLKLMEASHEGWLCDRLDRFGGEDGILKGRENRVMKNYSEPIPPFIPLILEKTARHCPEATIRLMRAVPTTRHPNGDKERAKLALRFCEMADVRNGPTREFCRT